MRKVLLSKLSVIVTALLLVAAISFLSPHQSAFAQSSGRLYHVTGQQLPSSLTSPTPIEGGALTVSNTVNIIVIANTDTVSHTVTVQDCQTTPFILFNAYPIPATTTWTVPLEGTRFQGCIKWSASSTTVMGTIVGTK